MSTSITNGVWLDEKGNLVVDLKKVAVVYIGNDREGGLFFRGKLIENLAKVEIEHEANNVPHVTMEVLGKGRDD